MTAKSANKAKTGKGQPASSRNRKGTVPKSAWKPGQSGNPKGRPREGESFAHVMREVLAMSGPEVAAAYQQRVKEYSKLPAGVTIRQLIVLRWIEAILNEPTPGLLQQMVDRVDGPVPTRVEGAEGGPVLVKIDK